MSDVVYSNLKFTRSEIEHKYGDNVHIVANPVAMTVLQKLCSPDVFHPELNIYLNFLYEWLIDYVVNCEFPRKRIKAKSRMIDYTEKANYELEIIDPDTKVVSVDIARAGILPSMVCFNKLNFLLNPRGVRQDHLIMNRITNENQQVTGAGINGSKIGGPIGGRIVLFPDPMGATGSSIIAAINHYKSEHLGKPYKIITLNLIITPEFIRNVLNAHSEVIIYAFRLDRGLSDRHILSTIPGTYWDEEKGLNEYQYIVPGAGGLGEILNNAFV